MQMWVLIALWFNGVPSDLARLGVPPIDEVGRYQTEAECKNRQDHLKKGGYHQDIIFKCIDLHALDN